MIDLSNFLKTHGQFNHTVCDIDGFKFMLVRVTAKDFSIGINGEQPSFIYPETYAAWIGLPHVDVDTSSFGAAVVKADRYADDLNTIRHLVVLNHQAPFVDQFNESDLEIIEGWANEVQSMTMWGDDATKRAQGILDVLSEHRIGDTHALEVSQNHGFVYLAHCSTGHYKIGRSRTPTARVKHFDTQMPVEVELLHFIETDDAPSLEKRFHQHYEATRHKTTEWFKLTFEDVDRIRSIKEWRCLRKRMRFNGTFDERMEYPTFLAVQSPKMVLLPHNTERRELR